MGLGPSLEPQFSHLICASLDLVHCMLCQCLRGPWPAQYDALFVDPLLTKS